MLDLLQRKTISVLLVIATVWFGLNAYRLHLQQGSQGAQLTDVQSRINDAERENHMLASSSAYFQSDAYLERQARMKLNYKLPDEQVAFVYPDASASSKAELSKGNDQLPNWQKWWYYILGK